MKIQDAEQAIKNARYKVEILGLAPFQWLEGDEPYSFVAFWKAKTKQPGGQYTLCTLSKKDGANRIVHKGNYEELIPAQEAFCRLVYPYQD